ncbi:DUF4259 domain-containing protein [Dactylosporangium sp. NPDC049525]|uniref:DUF4259 domain-containing protein n=1 Tax=Dactylosporangium sp. NPDC049525 TaxID=3154730 RepID=UPI0034332CE7
MSDPMGTWDVGPFGNDDAADFAYDLDEAPMQARVDMIGRALDRVIDAADDSGLPDAPRAVAAAALIAAQYPGGESASTRGPSTPMPQFPAYFRELAINALDRVITAPAWLTEDWDAKPEGPAWRRTIADLRNVLDPPQEEALFDI